MLVFLRYFVGVIYCGILDFPCIFGVFLWNIFGDIWGISDGFVLEIFLGIFWGIWEISFEVFFILFLEGFLRVFCGYFWCVLLMFFWVFEG